MSNSKCLATQRHEIIATLGSFYDDQCLCDVTLVVKSSKVDGAGDEVLLDCHRVVLAASSGHFKELFIANNVANIIDISKEYDIDYSSMKMIVDGMYNRQVRFTEENIWVLYEYSETWNIPFLRKQCLAYLTDHVTLDGAFDYYEKLSSGSARDQFKSLIRQLMTDVKNSQKWSSVSRRTLVRCIQLKIFNDLSADDTFNMIVSWIDSNSNLSEDNSELYELINYDKLTKEFLCDVVLFHPHMQQQPQLDLVRMAMVKLLKNPKPSNIDAARKPRSRTKEPPSALAAAASTSSSQPGGTVSKKRAVSENRKMLSPTLSAVKLPSTDKSRLILIDKENVIHQLSASPNQWQKLNGLFGFSDQSTICTFGTTHLAVLGSSENNQYKKVVLVGISGSVSIANLPRFPAHVHSGGMVSRNSEELIFIGGENINAWPDELPATIHHKVSNRAFHLKTQEPDTSWEKLPNMPMIVQKAIVVWLDHRVFALGGVLQGACTTIVQVLNTTNMTWTHWMQRELPVCCSSAESGAVAYKDEIFVFTPETCIRYDNKLKSWTAYPYSKVGERIKPLVFNGKIVALISNGEGERERKCLKIYDESANSWKNTSVGVDKVHKSRLYVL